MKDQETVIQRFVISADIITNELNKINELAVLTAGCRGDAGPEADAARREARATSRLATSRHVARKAG